MKNPRPVTLSPWRKNGRFGRFSGTIIWAPIDTAGRLCRNGSEWVGSTDDGDSDGDMDDGVEDGKNDGGSFPKLVVLHSVQNNAARGTSAIDLGRPGTGDRYGLCRSVSEASQPNLSQGPR